MLHGTGETVVRDLIWNHVAKYSGGASNARVLLEAMGDAAVVDDMVFKSVSCCQSLLSEQLPQGRNQQQGRQDEKVPCYSCYYRNA